MRFLVETERALQYAGKAPSQVRWVGSRDGTFYVSWEEFVAFAAPLTYQRFSGNDVIARDLVIVGADWWMERTEVGGVQSWELKEYPRRKGSGLTFRKILSTRGSPASIRRMNPVYGISAGNLP